MQILKATLLSFPRPSPKETNQIFYAILLRIDSSHSLGQTSLHNLYGFITSSILHNILISVTETWTLTSNVNVQRDV